MKTSKIWIIDDNPIDSYIVKTMLELNELSKDIHVFSNNKEALDSLEELNEDNSDGPIHIITENKTNAVNGWKLIKKMSNKFYEKKQKFNLKFHMTSEKYTEDDFEKFEKTDPLCSINKKPLRLDHLINMLQY
ncbi:response regulator [Nonlabens mediterrranea]|uniref:Response regulator n=1 Tax=Nonlabens mediterrranea TaxID=1419947 RepID=A0ABS0A9J7_9FLAO|nr:hypothetical protein BBFL7_01728 [Flavobacteria bacterium BBFL7]MBF4986070.1 response regulator [Nonlabens mediterrranea]